MLESYSNYAEHTVFHQQASKKVAFALLGGTLFADGGVNFIREIFNRDLVGEKGNPDLVTR